MTYHSSRGPMADIWNETVWLAHRAYADEQGEVLLIGATCGVCNAEFETTLEDALARVWAKKTLLCLGCDDEKSRERSVRAVRFAVWLIW